MSHLYRNQSIDLLCKSNYWFLYKCSIGLILGKILVSVLHVFRVTSKDIRVTLHKNEVFHEELLQ